MSEQIQSDPPLEEQSEGVFSSDRSEQPPETQPTSGFKFPWKFAIGFLGWYLVVGMIYGSLLRGDPDPQGYGAMIISLIVFPMQIVILIILFVVKDFRKIGWGMLSAIGLNLLMSMILGLSLNAVCFIPFFTPAN